MSFSSTGLAKDIVRRVRSVTNAEERLSLHEPSFHGKESDYVNDCLNSGWVSSAGNYVDLFEEKLCDFTGLPYTVAVVNGTCALQLSLKLIGVCADDEVLVPSLSFVATANAVVHCGATPHFIDSEPKHFGIDPNKLSDYLKENTLFENDVLINKHTRKKISALVPMHVFGHLCEISAICEIAGKYHLPVVEDAAEALGSRIQGGHACSWGRVGVLSFNGNKVITTGGGGAILTRDRNLGERAKHLSNTAKSGEPFIPEHDEVGYNYRMPNINAAIGCGQMEQLGGFLDKKRQLAQDYVNAFDGFYEGEIIIEQEKGCSNYWLNVLLLKEECVDGLNKLLSEAENYGVMLRGSWKPLHTLAMYQDCPRMNMDMVERLSQLIICLPSSPFLAPSKS